MRTAQKRTIEDTWRHVGSLVSTISKDELDMLPSNNETL
jgi:hypothetical protein